jgi:hypothetical protein
MKSPRAGIIQVGGLIRENLVPTAAMKLEEQRRTALLAKCDPFLDLN